MQYPNIEGIVARIPEERRGQYPLAGMLLAADELTCRRTRRIERALAQVRILFPSYAKLKEQSLIDDADTRNCAALLGEMRALADLSSVWGDKITTPRSGSDFLITSGSRSLQVEVATVLGATKDTSQLIDKSQKAGTRITTTGVAPFGYPSDKRPDDTVQGNAVSRLASIKQSEHQADPSAPSVLWMDFEDHVAFPLSIGANQTQPLIGGGMELVSGALWWMSYGRKGDTIFDRWSTSTPEVTGYSLEFDGRFGRQSRFAGTVCAIDGDHVFHQNHLASIALDAEWVLELLQLPGARIESWWADWPVSGTLSSRVQHARDAAAALAKYRQRP